MMTFDEYQISARRTQNHENPAHFQLDHALCGLAAETGEVLGCYQKVYQGHKLDVTKVIDEMGDVMWFLSELADCIGISLSTVAGRNIKKLQDRYPDGFDADKSVNRKEYQV